MKIIVKAVAILLLFAMLGSCTSFVSTPATTPTDGMDVQQAIPSNTSLLPIDTQQAFPTPTQIDNPTAVFTPAPDQEVYTDPDGWYSVFFPADMKPADKPSFFSRVGDFLETGYLSELGYMSNILNVCAWLANIEFEPEQSTIEWGSVLSPTFQSEPKCAVSINVSVAENIRYEVFENPAASPEHRFVYIKTGWSSFSAMNGNIPRASMVWLKPITPRQEATLAPLNDEEVALWEQSAPLLKGVLVTEYTLPAGSDPSQHEWLLKELPERALPEWYTNRASLPVPTKTPTIEEQLKPLGYEKRIVTTDTGLPLYYQLYRDRRLLFDYLYKVSDVYNYSMDSGQLNAFIVYTLTLDQFHSPKEIHGFLIQNDAIYPWEYNHQDPPFNPILYQNEILWLKTTKDFDHVQVLKSNQEIVSSFAVYTEPLYTVNRFTTWNGHWILSARDFLIQDGEIINEKLGLEEIFSWGLIKEKPVYLFRKGPRIGISYDGNILPLEYQDVARYKCCGFAVNNPSIDHNSVHFFGKRDGVWHYVVVEIK